MSSPAAAARSTRGVDQPRAAVDAGDARAARGQLARVRALAAAEIEDAAAGDVAGEREHARLEKQILVVARVGVRDPVVGGGVPRSRRRVGHFGGALPNTSTIVAVTRRCS